MPRRSERRPGPRIGVAARKAHCSTPAGLSDNRECIEQQRRGRSLLGEKLRQCADLQIPVGTGNFLQLAGRSDLGKKDAQIERRFRSRLVARLLLDLSASPAQRSRFGDDAIVDQSFKYFFPLLSRTHRCDRRRSRACALRSSSVCSNIFPNIGVIGVEIFFFFDAGESRQRFFTNARILEKNLEPIKIGRHESPGQIPLVAQKFFGCQRDTLWEETSRAPRSKSSRKPISLPRNA